MLGEPSEIAAHAIAVFSVAAPISSPEHRTGTVQRIGPAFFPAASVVIISRAFVSAVEG